MNSSKQVKHVTAPQSVVDAFKEILKSVRAQAGNDTECWLWPDKFEGLTAGITLSNDGSGYGQLGWKGDNCQQHFISAHRLAYFVTHQIPKEIIDKYTEIGVENLSALERFEAMRHDEACGEEKRCFNPSHLIRGDAILNSLDRRIDKIRDKNWQPSDDENRAKEKILTEWRGTKDFRSLRNDLKDSKDDKIVLAQWQIARMLHQWGGHKLSHLLKNPRLHD